jgi:GNAT superfamily N-acetyltransferase
MDFHIIKSDLKTVEPLRSLFLSETKFQFIYNKCHSAGWADVYLFTMNDLPIGYGSVWGKDKRENRDTIFEYYLTGPYRSYASRIFAEFIKSSGAGFIECQSNDILLTRMLFEYARNINAEAILFKDCFETELRIPGTGLVHNKGSGEDPEYRLDQHGEVVATGGFVWNYNYPFIDIYYEVKEAHQKKGYGSLIVQELKKEAYRLGRVPAARCNVKNLASQRTLMKSGMRICGHILIGETLPPATKSSNNYSMRK